MLLFGFNGRATRNFLILLVSMHYILFIDRVNLAAAAPVMQQDLGLSNLALGFAFSAFNYSYAPFQLVGGWFADRFGARRTLTVCGLVWSLTTIAIGATHAAGRLGAGTAAPIVAFLIAWFSWRFSFVAVGLLSTLWAIVWWWYFYEDPRQHPRITSAELAALPATDHATLAGSGPVPWRRLIPRVAPLMIVYFCQGWTGWLFVTWMPSLLQKNYGVEIKKSAFLYMALLFSGFLAELIGGMTTDSLLRRTGSLQIARSLMIAGSWVFAVAGLVPVILFHDMVIGVSGFMVTVFFLGFAISPLWTATMDIAPDYAGTSSSLMNASGAVAGILSPVAFAWILDRTGSWTLPFAVSVCLLLFAIVVTFWIRPDRTIEVVPSVGRLAAAGE
jgi:nitrate/nitrite transporter NarK